MCSCRLKYTSALKRKDVDMLCVDALEDIVLSDILCSIIGNLYLVSSFWHRASKILGIS